MRIAGARPGGAGTLGAFSLVEVVLAMGVVAFGILSVMSLYSSGLDQLARGERDVRATLFADDVFASLRIAAADDLVEWNWLINNNPTYSFPISGADPANPQWVGAAGPGGPMRFNCRNLTTNSLVFTNKNIGAGADLRQYAIHYQIFITNLTPSVKGVILRVGGGQYGVASDMQLFYTELYKMKP